MAELPILSHDAILAAVPITDAIERVRAALVRHHEGAWEMPAKVYLASPPYGDFRAMPARGDGLAMIKWISSFPDNPAQGLPTVMGVLVLSDAATSAPLAILEASAVTALRTGAIAAVAAQALAEGRSCGVVGCGVNGAFAARALAAAGFGPGICHDVHAATAERLADELGWRAGTLADALACDVVTCVTPGYAVIVERDDLRPGMHLNMLGADGPGKAEATIGAVAACTLFCDEWAQASHGGELTGAVKAGRVDRGDVTDIGAVLAGDAAGRTSADAITLFDSTGLAIQDLAIGAAALDGWREGRIEAQVVAL